MKHVIKPALALFTIAAVATTLLILVQNLTSEPIENQRRRTQENGMMAVLPETSQFNKISLQESGNIHSVYEGVSGGETIGYVVELSPSGYSGPINILVGISTLKNEISGMRVIRHSETPGLGALIVREDFFRRFDNRRLVPLRVVTATPGENDIEALSGATISTRAITNAVNEAIEWFYRYKSAD